MPTRRAVTAAALATLIPGTAMAADAPEKYALLGKMIAQPGQRDALIAILLEGTTAMPGCLLYILSTAPAEPDALWINEVWQSRQHHADSLKLPAVQAAIARGRPLIAGFGERFEMTPVGGVGL